MCFPILHLPRVELRCKLQVKLHRVTGPLVQGINFYLFFQGDTSGNYRKTLLGLIGEPEN